MKKAFILMVLALTLSTFAFASSGLNGEGMITGNDLGSINSTTETLTNGSLQMGGTLGSGDSLALSGNGSNRTPYEIIFSGTFSGPVTWTERAHVNGSHDYSLTGAISDSVAGTAVQGATIQFAVNTGASLFNGDSMTSASDNSLATGVAPEPSSLSLMGIGLIGLAGLLRRKLKN